MEETLSAMVGRLRHRGPDDLGKQVVHAGERGAVGFGHTRLAILDISSAGHQPMRDSEGGNAITFNGEIYNFHEIRDRMSAVRWQSQSDTEVILQAYKQHGARCVESLRGMFAFAIWDEARQEVFLARDRLGIKPIYYYAADGVFLFASEIRALLATGMVPREIDEVGLWGYLGYQSVPAPRTMINGVRMLPPGHWLRVNLAGEVREERYWDAAANAAIVEGSETQCRAKVRELLGEAVALHLVSDVPVAAFLSGGIDSSAIATLMREAGHRPSTFSVVFSEGDFDETRYARRIADQVQADHTEIHLREGDLLAQLPQVLGTMDHPTGDGVNIYVVARAVREAGVKVALSGLGGDEFFAGYPSFSRMDRVSRFLRAWGAVPAAGRAIAARGLQLVGGDSVAVSKTRTILESDGTMAEVFPFLRQVLSRSQRSALLVGRVKAIGESTPDPYVGLLREAFARRMAGVLAQVSYAEARTYMHDVLLRDTDQMSMAHALEVRVPFLDHKLVEYLMGVPDAYKRSNGTPKRLLVESLGSLLPSEIVHRPKRGFTLPFEVWMRGALRGYCEQRLDRERVRARGLFDPEAVWRLWEAFLSGSRSVSWSRVWVLVVLEEWLERNEIRSCA